MHQSLQIERRPFNLQKICYNIIIMIDRSFWQNKITKLFKTHRIVALLGARQCGKTTLAKQYARLFPTSSFFDLENPIALSRLRDPMVALEPLSGLIIIDEVQLQPELFTTLRYIHDEYPDKRFLLLGSASRDLIQKSSETLAGRIAYIELMPFMLDEIDSVNKLWIRGGYPKSYLQDSDDDSYVWRENYIRSYLEQDLNMLGVKVSPGALRQFWTMLTHYHGQIFNANEIAQSLGITHPTAKHYLDILHQTFMIRILRPYHANIKKRQVKSPKIYWRDSGIFHSFINTKAYMDLILHPKIGSSFEGFAMEQVIHAMDAYEHDCYFWNASSYGEIDLIISKDSKLYGFEFKFSDNVNLDKRWPEMIQDIGLEHLYVISPGEHNYKVADNITALGIKQLQHLR